MKDFKLIETCGACPEAYDVYKDGEYVGYLHLRWGHFAAYYGEICVCTASPKGDGIFLPEERTFYINEGCKAIRREMVRWEVLPEETIFEIGDMDHE